MSLNPADIALESPSIGYALQVGDGILQARHGDTTSLSALVSDTKLYTEEYLPTSGIVHTALYAGAAALGQEAQVRHCNICVDGNALDNFFFPFGRALQADDPQKAADLTAMFYLETAEQPTLDMHRFGAYGGLRRVISTACPETFDEAEKRAYAEIIVPELGIDDSWIDRL